MDASNPSKQYNLTNSPNSYDSSPSWSPDGTSIVFVSNRDGKDSLYVINIESGSLEPLSLGVEFSKSYNIEPSWGPNDKIAFSSDKTGLYKLYVWDKSGIQTVNTYASNTDHAPKWSPDGKLLAFVTNFPAGNQRVFVTSVYGTIYASMPADLTSTNPTWQP